MQTRFLLLGLVSLGISFAACTSEVPLGEGSEARSQGPGGEGQPPLGSGACNPGLSECRGRCTAAPCSGPDGGPATPDRSKPDAAPRPAPQVLAQDRNGANGIVVDSTSIYWTETGVLQVNAPGKGSVLKMPLAGGAPVTIAANEDGPSGIAVDATAVYFTNVGHITNTVPSGGSVKKVPRAGGQPPTVIDADTANAGQIGLDGAYVYYVSNGHTITPPTGKIGLFRAPIIGGAPEQLTTFAGFVSHHVAINANNLVWASPNVIRTDLLGQYAGSTPLLWSSGDAQDVAIDGTHAYFTTSSGTLLSVALTGGPATELSNGSPGSGKGIAIDATHAYWIACVPATGVCSVQRVLLTGGATETIASSQALASYLALDSGFVYWTTRDAILRAPK